jgi:hypothetical protein
VKQDVRTVLTDTKNIRMFHPIRTLLKPEIEIHHDIPSLYDGTDTPGPKTPVKNILTTKPLCQELSEDKTKRTCPIARQPK